MTVQHRPGPVGGARPRLATTLLAEARRHRALWPAAAIVAASLVAYNLTLGSIFDYLRLQTPLAYLPLLPLFSLAIALVTANRYRDAAKPIRDRQTDVLIGVPLIVIAMVLVIVVPPMASTYYWSSRPDVLSMASFVAGLVTLFYGVTWLWRIKASLFFLILTWPALYLTLMPGVMRSFTDATNTLLAKVAHALPIGVALTGSPGVLLVHQASGPAVSVSVGSACSGADSVLGFLLIGGAILTAMGPGRGRKFLWLAVGLTLTFLANLLRLTSILALVADGHPDLALGGYHAVIGLIVFSLVVAVMILLLPVFRLRLRAQVVSTTGRTVAASVAPPPQSSRTRRRATIAATAALALLLGIANRGLAPFAAFQDGTGAPTVRSFSAASAPVGWGIRREAAYPWAQQYFGAGSSFTRYVVRSPAGSPSATAITTAADPSRVVYADVVRTDDKGSLDAYNLQNCFLFHNYSIVTSKRIDVGSGVTALLLNYSDPATQARWATVSWAWPVNSAGVTYYERMALTSSLTTAGSDADLSPTGGLDGLLVGVLNLLNGSHDDKTLDALYNNADTHLRFEAASLITFAVRHRV